MSSSSSERVPSIRERRRLQKEAYSKVILSPNKHDEDISFLGDLLDRQERQLNLEDREDRQIKPAKTKEVKQVIPNVDCEEKVVIIEKLGGDSFSQKEYEIALNESKKKLDELQDLLQDLQEENEDLHSRLSQRSNDLQLQKKDYESKLGVYLNMVQELTKRLEDLDETLV